MPDEVKDTMPLTINVASQMYADLHMYFDEHHKRKPDCCTDFDHWCAKAIGRKLIVDQMPYWQKTLGSKAAVEKAKELAIAYHCS